MYKNKNHDGSLNLCGAKVKSLRLALSPTCSQRLLADKLQLIGLDVDKNAIQKIECGKRFVTDIELVALAQVFAVDVGELCK